MKVTKKIEISATETIIRLFTEKYNDLVKQGTTFQQRKYLADFLDKEKKYLLHIKTLPNTISCEELDRIYFDLTK